MVNTKEWSNKAQRLSVAMATFNGGKYIEEQLWSIAAQSLKPDELVITDDGSTDETIEIIQDFERQAPFEVLLVCNENNLGYAKNFDKAVGLCSGHIIFLSDQDDFWLQEKLERVQSEFRANPEIQIVINDAQIVDGDLGTTGLTKLGQTRSLGLNSRAFVTGCCSAFRAEFRDIFLPVPTEIFVHDTWLHALGDFLEVRSVLEEPLQLFRRHDANTSSALSSALTPVGRNDLFRAYSERSSRDSTELILRKIHLLRERLLERSDKMSWECEYEFTKALTRLDCWQEAAHKRLHILSRKRIARIIPAAKMYLRGQYAEFSGWRSLGKDIVMP